MPEVITMHLLAGKQEVLAGCPTPHALATDMGECKTYGGKKTCQRTRSPENFWAPPKELLVYSVVDFCTGKTEYEGGPRPLP